MPFSIAVFLASLWGLSSEMLEDAAVDFVYASMFGLRRVAVSLISSAGILATFSVILILLFKTTLLAFLPIASFLSVLFIGAMGLYWLYFAFKGTDSEYVPDFSINPFPLVFTEVLELFLILLPLSLTNYILEALASASVGVAFSLTIALIFRKIFSRLTKGRLRLKRLKLLSGSALILLALFLLIKV